MKPYKEDSFLLTVYLDMFFLKNFIKVYFNKWSQDFLKFEFEELLVCELRLSKFINRFMIKKYLTFS